MGGALLPASHHAVCVAAVGVGGRVLTGDDSVPWPFSLDDRQQREQVTLITLKGAGILLSCGFLYLFRVPEFTCNSRTLYDKSVICGSNTNVQDRKSVV